MFKIISLISLVLSLVLPTLAQQKPPPTPPSPPPPKRYTIKGDGNSPASKAEKERPTVGITIDKHVSNYTLNGDGTAKHVWEYQQTCASVFCESRIKQFSYIYNKDLQNIKLLDAFIVKADGTKIELGTSAGRSLPTPLAEAAPGFSSLHTFEINYEKAEVGDRIAYKLEIETTKPIFGEHFDSLERFPLTFAWKSVEINVDAPDSQPVFFESTGLTGGQISSANGRTKWQWKLTDSKALPVEAGMYDQSSRSPRFALTTMRSFDELGAAYWNGFIEKAKITPEVVALANEITKGIEAEKEQAAAIYMWVNKNIRYLSVVMDRGGWVPHSTDEILRNRYGDCKDYSVLIYALLKAKNIESIPVLINADFGSWFPSVASMDYFNHAILYVPGSGLFADATSPNTRLGIIPQTLIGKKAVFAGERSRVTEVPKDIPDDNQMLSDTVIMVLANGDLKVDSKNTYVGRSEILFRPIFSGGTVARNSEIFVKALLGYYGITGNGRIVSLSDAHKVGEPFKVDLEMTLPDHTTLIPNGSFQIPTGINMITIAELAAFTGEDARNTDLITGATRIKERFVLKLPEKASFRELPEPNKFKNNAGSYTLTHTLLDPRSVEIDRELVILKDTFSPSEYPLFRELINHAVESLNTTVPYNADRSFLNAKDLASRKSPKKNTVAPKKTSVFDEIWGLSSEKLKPAELRRLEAKVKASPKDSESRGKLIRHYMRYDVKETPAIIRTRTAHRLWFVQNRPDGDPASIYGYLTATESELTPEYITLRDEWMKQIALNEKSTGVRLNAASFVSKAEPELAKLMLSDGIEISPDVYEFRLKLAMILTENRSTAEENTKAELDREILSVGSAALDSIKKERSEKRDEDRARLLIELTPVAAELSEWETAERFARELVLDFGSDPNSLHFEKAVHIANTSLGKAALAKNDKEKAAEYLLISIRAVLRDKNNFTDYPDMSLAKALYKAGERKAVIEYLTLCLELNSFDEEEMYEDEISLLKKWIEEVKKDVEPSFDLDTL